MAVINFLKKEIQAKIVYYGPGLSGKTTNVKKIYESLPKENTGELVTLSTETDRTLFFDFIPINVGTVAGFKVKFQLFTVPGQVRYNATRRIVLQNADGIVFVADSQTDLLKENEESLINLKENLSFYGRFLKDIPLVFQFNKRDLPNILPLETMNRQLNPDNLPNIPSEAINGKGVNETLAKICGLVLQDIKRNLQEKRGIASRESISIDSSGKALKDEEVVRDLLHQISEVRPLENVFGTAGGGRQKEPEIIEDSTTIDRDTNRIKKAGGNTLPYISSKNVKIEVEDHESEEKPIEGASSTPPPYDREQSSSIDGAIRLPYPFSVSSIRTIKKVGEQGLVLSLILQDRDRHRIPAKITILFDSEEDLNENLLEKGIKLMGLGRIPLYALLLFLWLILITIIILI